MRYALSFKSVFKLFICDSDKLGIIDTDINEFVFNPQDPLDIHLFAIFSQLDKSVVKFVICDSFIFEFDHLVEIEL